MLPTKFIERYRIDKPDRFRLSEFNSSDTAGLNLDKDDIKDFLTKDAERLGEMQERLFAQDKWSLLVVLQGMDTAGKDGVIKHVMAGVNPQGCIVHAFKAPSAEELDHDFLWRSAMRLPERGRIGIFNRSYYEEVLIVRVHPEILASQLLPRETCEDPKIWKHRFRSILDTEKHLHCNGTRILKFFLHISKEEQRKRLLARLDDPKKRWKFDKGDLQERALWKEYRAAYEDCLAATSTKHAPWYVIPADDKKNARLILSQIIVEHLESLDLRYPVATALKKKELVEIRKRLAK